jgi:hypothetical protein
MAIQFTTVASSDTAQISTPSNAIGGSTANMSAHFAFQFDRALTNTSPSYPFGSGVVNPVFLVEMFTGSSLNLAYLIMTGVSNTAEVTNQILEPNTPYVIDMVWTSGLQTFYLNGVALGTRTVSGNTDPGQSLHIGISAGSTALNMTISQPMVWSSYANTSTDVINLLTGGSSATPPDWAPTLAGTIGATPTGGDPGLDNHAGAAGNGAGNVNVLSSLSFTAGGSAQYIADLVWTPVPVTTYVTSDGKGLLIGASAPNGLPTANAVLSAVSSTLPTVNVNGSPATLWSVPVYADTTLDLPWVLYQFRSPSSILPTDIVTATIPFATITTAQLGPNGPFTGTITNSVGQQPPAFNGCTPFGAAHSMGVGWCGIGAFFYNFTLFPAKNARLRFGSFGPSVTYDANNQPLYITPNTAVATNLWQTAYDNFVDARNLPCPTGVYSFTFQDTNALDVTNHLKVWLVGNSNCAGCDTASGPATGARSTYVRTVAADGVTVTVSYWISYASDPNYSTGYELSLEVFVESATGYFSQAGSGGSPGSGPISNFWAFIPGDSTTTVYNTHSSATSQTSAPSTTGYSGTIPYSGPFPNSSGNDNSDPLAMSECMRLYLTSANGNGVATLRSMPLGNGFLNWLNATDLPSVNLWSYANEVQGPGVTISTIRAYNTDPTNATYAWSSTKIYDPMLGNDGSDSVGSYIDLTAHNNLATGLAGTKDNGAAVGCFMEAVFTGPHGFRGRDMVNFPVNNIGPHYVAIVGGDYTTLSGTVHITNGSQSITFSTSQTIASGTWFMFVPFDGNGYLIETGGTGTSFTLTQAYQGTTETTATAIRITQPPLAQTVSVTNDSTSVTFSSTVTIPNGQAYQLDSTGAAYVINTGGTGTTFTIFPQYQGTTAGANTVTPCAAVSIAQNVSVVYPTAADKLVFSSGSILGYMGQNPPTPSPPLKMVSTSPVPFSYSGIVPLVNVGIGPFEFWAKIPVEVGADPWLFFAPQETDACTQAKAALIAPYCPPGTVIKYECGDEHWNGDETLYAECLHFGNLCNYQTRGTVINDFYTIPASGPATLTTDEAYVVISAHKHEVMQAKFDALGSGITVEPVFGSWWMGAGTVTGAIVNAASGTLKNGSTFSKKVRIGSIAVAPYENLPTANATMNQAITTTGVNPGSWPCSLILEMERHHLKYSISYWDLYAAHAAAIDAYVANGGPTGVQGQVGGRPTMIGYESAYDQSNGGTPVMTDPVAHDCFYSPGPHGPLITGAGALIQGYLQALQDGDPRVPGSGLVTDCYQSLAGAWGSPTNYWTLAVFQNQPAGDGLGNLYSTFTGKNLLPPANTINQFATAQGGTAGAGGYGVSYDRENQSIALYAVLDWIEGGAAAPAIGSIAAGERHDTPAIAGLVPSFAVKPTRIQPKVSAPRLLTLAGIGTSWSSGSSVSITNSVTGTTTVTAGTFTAISAIEATLAVTTSAGTGTFTITIDGITASPTGVGSRLRGWFPRLNRLVAST